MRYNWRAIRETLVTMHKAPVANQEPIKEQYDHEVNMGYIYLVKPSELKRRFSTSVELGEAFTLDVDTFGIVLGIEIFEPNPKYINHNRTYGYGD